MVEKKEKKLKEITQMQYIIKQLEAIIKDEGI
jgi:hypothetical protein